MMEQEKVAQESEHTVTESEAVEEAIKDEADIQRNMKYNAIGLFIMGALFAIAPTYLQTNILWILILSSILVILCWLGALLCVSRAYPHIHANQPAMMLLSAACAFCAYFVPIVPNQLASRAFSFFFLLALIVHFLFGLPKFVESYKQHKDRITALFTPKNIIAAIGGALVFVTALLTFLQTVFQIFHR